MHVFIGHIVTITPLLFCNRLSIPRSWVVLCIFSQAKCYQRRTSEQEDVWCPAFYWRWLCPQWLVFHGRQHSEWPHHTALYRSLWISEGSSCCSLQRFAVICHCLFIFLWTTKFLTCYEWYGDGVGSTTEEYYDVSILPNPN